MLTLVIFLRKLAARFNQGKELWLLVRRLLSKFSFHLTTLLFFDLLHRLKEELFDVRALVKDHLADLLQTIAFVVLLSNRLVKIVQFFVLLSDDLFVLELK